MNHVPLRAAPVTRLGATLTEVLITILIMSIGLVGVMSLFPASILRSVQAHALTTATNLRFSAEASLAQHPQIIGDADRIPGFNSDTNGDGNRWNDQFQSVFIVDPFLVSTRGIASGSQLGGVGSNTISVFHAGFTTLPEIESVFSSPDKWTIQHESVPFNGDLGPAVNPQSLSFRNLTDQQVYVGPGLAPTRLVIFNKSGKSCQVREINSALNGVGALGNTIYWSPRLPAPFSNATFANADIGNVRIEQRDLHFTWIVTVRGINRSTASPVLNYEATITAFYKRGYPDDDIRSFGNGPDFVFQKNSSTARVAYSLPNRPYLKRGSWVLDATSGNGFWYQIEEFVDDGIGSAILTLATPAREHGSAAVFMKAIVDVYPLNNLNMTNPPQL